MMMKICNDEVTEKKAPELIQGNLYQHANGDIYILGYNNTLIHLGDGGCWNRGGGFGESPHEFTDVTDQYCLKKISE